jgi:hypothetical protein
MKEVQMQTNKNNISDQAFDLAKSMNNVSRVGNLYGKLFALQETQIYILSEIKKVREQIEREDNE